MRREGLTAFPIGLAVTGERAGGNGMNIPLWRKRSWEARAGPPGDGLVDVSKQALAEEAEVANPARW